MIYYLDMHFDWDTNKAASNERKHGISFNEAMTVFDDGDALYIPDETGIEYEERFNILGMSNESNLLMVCHCYRDNDAVIRIISARSATKTEQNLYGGA